MTDPENDPVAAFLDGLRPAAPSDELMRRLAAARPIPRIVSRRDKVILFIPRIAMAAALVALASALAWKFIPRGISEDTIVGNPPQNPAVIAASVVAIGVPLQKRQSLIGVQTLGVTRDEQQGASRMMRTLWLDAETFTPPGGAPPVRVERVRDEIVPVAVSTF